MNNKFKYGTIMEALDSLREKGYNKDFQVTGDALTVDGEAYDADELRIDLVYRYEGATNPGDESSTYGISTKSGVRGVLIVTDGIYANNASSRLLQKLHEVKNEKYR